jgi:tetratricopeptide (TPR) repeat protein
MAQACALLVLGLSCVHLVRADANAVALLSEGRAALAAGDMRTARKSLQLAYEAAPADPRITLAYASVLRDEARARELLESLTTDSLATLSQKSRAFVLLAGVRYVKEDYLAAASLYGKAFELSARPEDAIRQGLSAMLAGDLSLAERLFSTEVDNANRGSGRYYRALLSLHRKDYAAALELFKESVSLSQQSAPWRPGAMAGQAVCAERLGYVSTASALRKEFETAYPEALERRLFRYGFAPLRDSREKSFVPKSQRSKRKTKSTPLREPSSGTSSYTIQVGSFGTPENARKLRKRMSEYFDSVRIVTARVSGRTYHRVRIGRFASRAKAEAFAQERVSPTGVSHKVVQGE